MKQFEHVLAEEFPVMYRDFGLDAAARAALDRYADELTQWMSGVAPWHAQTRRYREEDLKRHRAAGGTGGGRSAPGSAPPRLGVTARGRGALGEGGPGCPTWPHGQKCAVCTTALISGGTGLSPECDIPLAFRQNWRIIVATRPERTLGRAWTRMQWGASCR